jgi:hypothetical protein
VRRWRRAGRFADTPGATRAEAPGRAGTAPGGTARPDFRTIAAW